MGPVTYDIASLMRDAFISWDEAFVLDVTIRYWEKARKAGIPVPDDFGVFGLAMSILARSTILPSSISPAFIFWNSSRLSSIGRLR